MPKRKVPTCVLLFATVAALSFPAYAAEWEKVSDDDGLVIYNREKDGSKVKEFKGVATIDAPSWVCKNVADDEGHFQDFMPYTEESKIIKAVPEEDYIIAYHLISAPLVSDRDYTIRVSNESVNKPDGTILYEKRWTLANELGPGPKDGVVRVGTNVGYWMFEAKGQNKTKATYYVYTNPGGALPAWVVNAANSRAIPGLFEAIEEQAKKSKYRNRKPVLKGERETGASRPLPAAPEAVTTK